MPASKQLKRTTEKLCNDISVFFHVSLKLPFQRNGIFSVTYFFTFQRHWLFLQVFAYDSCAALSEDPGLSLVLQPGLFSSSC